MRGRKRFVYLLALSLCPTVTHAAMHVRGYTTDRHARFANSPNFIGAGYDFSGVGNSANGWVTMISPSHFLTAAHIGAGGTATFDRDNRIDNNIEIPLITRSVLSDSLVRLQNTDGSPTDLLFGRLDAPLTAADGIASYDIAERPAAGDYVGSTQFVYGRGEGGIDSDRLGRNTIDRVVPLREVDPAFEPASGSSPVTISNYDYTGGSGDDETFLMGGDSGGPNFLVIDGALALVGINWFNATADNDPNKMVLSGSSYVPAYASQIEGLMAVPEPASIATLATMTATLLLTRRRRGSVPVTRGG